MHISCTIIAGSGQVEEKARDSYEQLHQGIPSVVECANNACKVYRSRLRALAKDNPQRWSNEESHTKVNSGIRIAITKHSATKNSTQLRHDLRNGALHVFGDCTNCSKEFCTLQQNPSVPDDERDEGNQSTVPTTAKQTIEEQINSIIQTETELQISPHD